MSDWVRHAKAFLEDCGQVGQLFQLLKRGMIGGLRHYTLQLAEEFVADGRIRGNMV